MNQCIAIFFCLESSIDSANSLNQFTPWTVGGSVLVMMYGWDYNWPTNNKMVTSASSSYSVKPAPPIVKANIILDSLVTLEHRKILLSQFSRGRTYLLSLSAFYLFNIYTDLPLLLLLCKFLFSDALLLKNVRGHTTCSHRH